MEKVKGKARKKNVETGLLMGQNTNVFSQLSASLLQGRDTTTEEEQRFVQNTPLVEYHDPDVNRLLALLRKKAEVTKAKAASELREVINKMSVEQVEEFISTFAQLYLEIVLNESSKAIVEEFSGMASDLISKHKKVVITEISTLYPPLLVTHKLSKLAGLLFVGTEDQLPKKILVLLLKKEVAKKFIVMVKLVLDCQALQKIPQPQMQRNCQTLTKLLREILRIPVQELEEEKGRLFREICSSMGKECIDEYFRVGGKAQASILELYASLIAVAAKKPQWGLPWHLYSKTIADCFLSKDVLVQQALWRGAIHSWLNGLLEIEGSQGKEGERGEILEVYLPRSDDKLLSCLGVGGFTMYKELPRFLEFFPHAILNSHDSHRQLVNKLVFFKKLMNDLLVQEDENEARAECYASLVRLLVGRVRALEVTGEEKKVKELQSLCSKFEREVIMNLQDRYYCSPPHSKNCFSFYIPQHFGHLLNDLEPDFEVKFNPELSFQLYHKLLPSAYAQRILNQLFQHSKESQTLTLRFLQTFPKRKVVVDMSQTNTEVETAAKIFLLTTDIPKEGEQWIDLNWDLRKQLIAFDPRITQRDLQAQDQEDNWESLYFRPSHRSLLPRYDCSELDSFRFNYFKEALSHPERSHCIKYLLPFLSDILLPRNPQLADELFFLFAEKCRLAEEGSWAVSSHEVLIVRVQAQLLCEVLLRERGFSNFQRQPLEICLKALAQFVRLLYVYKMDRESEEVLRRLQGLLGVPDAKSWVLASCRETLKKTWKQLLEGRKEGSEKVRSNRIMNCLQFTHRILGVISHSELPEKLGKQFLLDKTNWKEGTQRSEAWHIFKAVMDSLPKQSCHQIIKSCVLSDNHEFQLALLLSAEVLLPLQAVSDLRRFFVGLKGVVQETLLGVSVEELSLLLGKLVQNVVSEGIFQLAEGARATLTYVFVQRQEENEELLKRLKSEILIKPFADLGNGDGGIMKTLIFNTIVSSTPIRKIPETEEVCSELLVALPTAQGSNFLKVVSTLSLLWSKGVGAIQLTMEEWKLLTEVICQTLKERPKPENALLFNFYHYVLFSLANTAVSLAGWSILDHFLEDIDCLFWEKSQKGQLDGLALCQKMKFASRAVLSREGPALVKLIIELPQVICNELDCYRNVLELIEREEQYSIQDSLVTLFIESAQFMLRASAFVKGNQIPSQQILLKLVQCPIPALRKAAFLMLKAMYEDKLVPRNIPSEFNTYLGTILKGELDGDFDKQAVSYFYCWQLILLRRQSTERTPQGEQDLPLSLEQILQPNGLSELLLRNCFWVIEDRLDYLKREGDFPVSSEELIQWDPERDFLTQNQPQKRIFLLALRTFFLFVSNFPVSLRDLIDKFKRYRPVCERLLRNVVTETIFREEVSRIQFLEGEWKPKGNFQIYVTPHNRQIYAEYCHETIRIGLRLLMKSIYPLAPIVLQFGEGLKVEEGGKWGLMLQSQLKSRNSSVIRGILLWKQNVDKRLSGVEECAICFDIVNNYGQLPKKGCKTCKKKFHGNCIMKWFSKSNKSECPLCKSQFL